MRLRRLFAACGAVVIAASVGCATAASYAAGLRVESNVPDATVWVDDALAGRVADWARGDRHVRAGFHRVEVRHPGFYSAYQEVDIAAGGSATVKAQLRPTID